MRAKACEYRRTIILAASVEQVFAFHANPDNIPKISPPWQVVRVGRGGGAVVGGEFEIAVRLFGIMPLHWRGVWREVNEPGLLVDEALRSPFTYWKHRHVFDWVDERNTRMTDHVTYAFPGGWLGKLFGETAGRFQFALMFADRQARTRRWFQAEAR